VGATAVRLPPKHVFRRLIGPAILVALIGAAWIFGLSDRLSWSNLAEYQTTLKAWVGEHPWLAPCIFLCVYTVSVTISLPQAALLTLIGGLLFGTALGGILTVIGATTGAVLLFLIARSALAEPLARRGGAALGKLRKELHQNGLADLFAIRLVPIVPFWLVNLAAPLCGMPLRHFIIATFFGVMPVTFITASIGAGIGGVLGSGERPSFGVLFSWPVLGPLIGLALASLSPVLWRKWRARHG
jgi:uncharacterized membrane protein YdjX (TVP38/TMEM64 family)